MEEYVGKLVIKTDVNSKDLEKKLSFERRKLVQFEKEAEKLATAKIKAEEDLQPYEEELALIKETTDEMLKQAQTKEEVDNIMNLEQKNIDELNGKYSEQLSKLENINTKIKENAQNQELTKQSIGKLNDQLTFARGFESINTSIKNINRSLTQTIKKLGRWALAIFGIRGAYMALRNAINVITQEDAQLKADIDYIKSVFAYSLEPIARRIVELAKQILIYIGFIIKKWTGKNIFENANKNLKNANSNAKELRKTLAGFDEMNILNEDGSVGIGGAISPSFDLSQDSIFANWNMEKFIEKGKEIATNIAKGINDTISKINWTEVGQTISMAIIGGIEILSTLIREIDWSIIGQSIAELLLSIDWLGIASAIIGLLFDGMIAGLELMVGVTTGIIKKLEDPKFYKDLVESGKKIIGKIGEGMEEIDLALEKVWGKIVGWFLKKLGFKNNDAEKVGNEIGKGIWLGVDTMIEQLPFYGTFYKLIKIARNVFGIHSPSTVMKDIGINLMEGLKNGLSSSANKIIDFINTLIKKINNSLSFKWNDITIGGVKLLNAGSLNVGKIPTIPRLAKGGIINMPGKGVYTGSAIAGEAGRELYMPLQDEQTLSMIGQAIGKYININATVPVYVGNRMVAKELKRINAEDDFAYNR